MGKLLEVRFLNNRRQIDPYKVVKVGPNEAVKGDPLKAVEKELEHIKYVKVPGLPSFTGIIQKQKELG